MFSNFRSKIFRTVSAKFFGHPDREDPQPLEGRVHDPLGVVWKQVQQFVRIFVRISQNLLVIQVNLIKILFEFHKFC